MSKTDFETALENLKDRSRPDVQKAHEYLDRIIQARPDGVRPFDYIEDTLFGGITAGYQIEIEGCEPVIGMILIVNSNGVWSNTLVDPYNKPVGIDEFLDHWKSDATVHFLKKYCGHKEV